MYWVRNNANSSRPPDLKGTVRCSRFTTRRLRRTMSAVNFDDFPGGPPLLSSVRLRLRGFEPKDCDAWFAWATDPRVFGPTSDMPPTTPEEFEEVLTSSAEQRERREAIRWVMRTQTTTLLALLDFRHSAAIIGAVNSDTSLPRSIGTGVLLRRRRPSLSSSGKLSCYSDGLKRP